MNNQKKQKESYVKTISKKAKLGLLFLFSPSLYCSAKTDKTPLSPITYNDIAQPAKFAKMTRVTQISSQEITERITPILQKHLAERNYNRVYLAEKFIIFYNQNRHLFNTPLKAFVAFDTKQYAKDKHNGVCFGLTKALFDKLPSDLHAYKIGAILPNRYQQNGWHLFPHTAIVIPYENPIEPVDKGYILLDTNFQISVPIVLRYGDKPVAVDLGKKGTWQFQLKANKIICHIFKEQNKTFDTIHDVMVYVLQEYLNGEEAALKTMIASDRRLPIVSQYENGVYKAHLRIDLVKKSLSSAIHGTYQPLISFEEFLSGKKRFDQTFANYLNMDVKKLNSTIETIIKNSDVLNSLTEQYFELLDHEK